ncbi:hypothetical protein M9H77_16253 [Catharanthus roseus]|uniref:Uncharacterized protein n=1 Tax=Catharanthus roseus TaxID=4058 RepID=A0ACC0AZS9_CATRO|nr:hypothetical protein M9H77_16253 [Catharanthus roseus]
MPKKKKLAGPSNTKELVMGAQVENEESDTNVLETPYLLPELLGRMTLYRLLRGITLYKVENDDVVEIEKEEIDDVIKTWVMLWWLCSRRIPWCINQDGLSSNLTMKRIDSMLYRGALHDFWEATCLEEHAGFGMAMKEPHKKDIASVTQSHPPDGQDLGTAKGKEANKGRPGASIILRGTRFHDMCGLRTGTKQYTLCYKLKKLKRSLKDLNKKHYGHISAKAEAAKSELKQKQEELHDNPHNEQLKEKRNAKRNFIAALTKEDGSTTSSLEEVQEELIRFYRDLLGTKNEYEKEAIMDLMGFSERNMPFRYLGLSLSSVYLKVADFAPLLNKVSITLLTWASLNLSYAGRLEVFISVVQGIESLWLGVLPISAAVLDRITGMCGRFLWGSNSARVTWHTMCLSN